MEANISLVWSHWVGDMFRRNSLSFSNGPDWVGTPLMATMCRTPPLRSNWGSCWTVRQMRMTRNYLLFVTDELPD